MRDSVSGLDYNHPIRNFIEQELLDPVDTKLKGLEKKEFSGFLQPIPQNPSLENFPDEFIYVGGTENSFDKSAVTSELQYCLFTCPGTLYENPNPSLTFTPLLRSRGSRQSGTTSLDNFWTGGVFGTPRRFNPDRTKYQGSNQSEIIAAAISGNVPDGNQTSEINVILVADIDVLADPFFNIRSRGPNLTFRLMLTMSLFL